MVGKRALDNLHFQEQLKVKPVAFSLKLLVILFSSQFRRFFNPWLASCASIRSQVFCSVFKYVNLT